MPEPIKVGTRERWSFAKINEVLDMPNLIQVQKQSYQWFIEEGLKEIFDDISPIQDFTGNLLLEFVGYNLGQPKHDGRMQRGI